MIVHSNFPGGSNLVGVKGRRVEIADEISQTPAA